MTTPEAQAQTPAPPNEAGIAPMTQAAPDATGTTTTATVPEQRTAPEPAEPSTPGGVPGIPLLTIGTTGTVTAVSTAGLIGGPVAAALVGGGLAASAAVAAVARAPRTDSRRTTRSTSPTRGASGAHRSGGARPTSNWGRTGGWRGTGTGSGGRRGMGAAMRSGASGIRAARTRAGQIRAARHAAAAAPVPRRQRREQLAADRRRLADARRNARTQAREQRRNAPGANRTPGRFTGVGGAVRGRGGRLTAGAGRAWGGLRRGRTGGGSGGGVDLTKRGGTDTRPKVNRRQARRQARDEIRNRRVAAERAHVEKRARERARKSALRRSAARFQARRVASALLASPLGLLSLLMWFPAKLLRVRPPQWGRRLYRHLALAATDARVRRDVAAYDEHDKAEAKAEADTRKRLGRPDRPADSAPASDTAPTPTTTTEEMNPMAFDFRAAAEEMLKQAQTAEPGGMMNVLAAFQTLPEAIGLIAETFGVVAGRISEEMPLEPPVADAVMELNKQLIACVDTASEVSRVFETTHEADIKRHTDPRTGEEAWDVSAQDD
jgi:hypothetical protein